MTRSIYTSGEFWSFATERAIKTGAQAAIAAFGVGGGLFDVDWEASVSMTLGAAVLSLLTSIGSGAVGEDNSPSLVSSAAPGVEPKHLAQDDDA